MSTARHHHWVSQLYLARFTERGDQHSNLYAVDLVQRKTFTPSPRNVCGKRDFNKILSPDLPPDALETSLSEFETLVDQALTEVLKDGRTFSAEAWHIVLNFMALLAARNPVMRKQAERFYGERVLRDLEEATNTPEKFAEVIAAAKAAGHLDKDVVTDYDTHRAFLAGRRFKLSFDPGFMVVGEFNGVDKLLKTLVERNWLLLEAPTDSGGFVTTDRPVTLCHTDGTPPRRGVALGFGTQNSMVLFALSPTLCAVGTFGGRDGITRVIRETVAKANCILIQHCDRLVFAPHDRFEVRTPNRSAYVVGSEIMEVLGERVEFEGP